jgi:hypothetical protein
MSNGSTLFRRLARLQSGSEKRRSRSCWRIVQFPVEGKIVGIWCTGNFGYVKPIEGAEKSCCKRRRKRGQRRAVPRSRGSQPRRSESLRPKLPPKSSGRNILRACKRMDYYKSRMELLIDKYSFVFDQSKTLNGKWRAAFREIASGDTLNVTLVPTRGYTLMRDRWRALYLRMKSDSAWVRPMSSRWSEMLDTRFRFQPPHVAPSWEVLVGNRGDLFRFLEDCHEMGIRPCFEAWHGYHEPVCTCKYGFCRTHAKVPKQRTASRRKTTPFVPRGSPVKGNFRGN